MSWPASLQARLGLSLGLMLALVWIAAATVTALIVRDEMDAVFDSALQEAAQRLLPLAVIDIVGREDPGVTQRLAAIREHDEFFTYVVRDVDGRVLLQSHRADPAMFPPHEGPGFGQTATHRLYSDAALQGTIRITVAEPLAHRASVAGGVRIVVDDLERAGATGRIALHLPQAPVMSDLDPDAFAILCRNLLENALRHGADGGEVTMVLAADGQLVVANDGPVIPPDTLNRLTKRFERACTHTDGSGLGLAIVSAIAARIGSALDFFSPRRGGTSGVEIKIMLPVDAPQDAPVDAPGTSAPGSPLK